MKRIIYLFIVCMLTGLLLNVNQIDAQGVSAQDSLSLVDLYYSTGGSEWANNSNWLADAVETWYGVTVSDGRVIGLYLGQNNLIGSIPSSIGDLDSLKELILQGNQLTGPVPAGIGSLIVLENLLLNNNQLTDLPDLSSLASLQNLEIQANNFTFKDIEPNVGVAGISFIYAPQRNIGTGQDTIVIKGTSLTLSVSAGGSSSQYQWWKFDQTIGDISGDSTYTIPYVEVSDAGMYNCMITNTVATELTLFSAPVRVFVRPPLDARVVAMLTPYQECGLTNSDTITIQIQNFGTEPISDFEVGYTLNGVPITPETITAEILPGDYFEYSFNAKADLTSNEFYTALPIEMYTMLPGDEQPENDVLARGISLYGDYMDKEGWTTYSICDGMAAKTSTGIAEDGSGNIWVGTNGAGVNVFDGSNWINYNTENSPLTSNMVEKMFADDLGNVWIATWQDEGGVCMYDGSSWTIYTTENSGIAGNRVEEVIKDHDGNYWFATFGGISKFDGISTWTSYNTGNSGLVNDMVDAITEDSDSNIWVGTPTGLSKFNVPSNTWTTYNTENSGMMSNNVYAVREDHQGNIWIGGWQGWISSFDGTTWTNYTPANSGILNMNVLSISVDSDGNIWFGTFGSGALKYDGTNWIVYNQQNGLATANLNGAIHFWADIYEDSNGNIWFPTYNGIARKEPVNIEIYHVDFSHASCNGTDGSITIHALAENPPLQYSVDGGNNFQPDNLFENLPPGIYPVSATDGTDTVYADPVTIMGFAEISGFPFMEDFDSYEFNSIEFDNGWYNKPGNQVNWTVHSGGTPTQNTGPVEDHTTGEGNYLYLEANNNYFKQAALVSPCFDISSLIIPSLSFYYHMFGENMGELHLDVYNEGTWNEDVVVIPGDQGDEWHQQMLNLSEYTGVIKLRFRGIVGDLAFSDIAIDDIEIREGPVDAGVALLIEPEGSCGFTGSENVTIEIFNNSLEALTGFNVGYSLNGVPVPPETITDIILPGDTLLYTFDAKADLYTNNYYNSYFFECYTLLPGDEFTENDTLRRQIWFYGDYMDKEGWTTYSICDGLASETTTGIVEDGSGNIWIGTQGGVNVFDGSNWINYNTDNSPLTSNAVEKMFADDLGNVWIGTWQDDGGVCMYDGSSWTIYTTETSGIAGNVVEEIIKDHEGNYWFATYDGISKFDGSSTWTNYNSENSGLVLNTTNAMTTME